MKVLLKLMIVVCLVSSAGRTYGSDPVQDSILLMEYLDQPCTDSITYVKVEEDSILVVGLISGAVPFARTLCEVPLWEHPGRMDTFSNSFPLTPAGDSIQIRVPRFYMLDGVMADRLYSRWALATGSEGNHVLTSHARSAGDVFDIAQWYSDEEFPSTVKGMGGISWQPGYMYDLNSLGVKSITINQLLHALISLTPTSTVHVYNGKSYYINMAPVDRLDDLLGFCNDNDIVASIILLVTRNLTGEAKEIWVHPDSDNGPYSMANVTSPLGLEYYTAVIDYLARRYSWPDRRYGRITNWIVHNEVDAGYYWTNAGVKPAVLYADLYMKSMKAVYYTARKYNPSARVFASITHHWNYSKKYFRPREFLEYMLDITEKEGDFEWGLAYHPYPRQLTKPKTWNDADVDWTDSTDYITPKNLEVIDAWIRQERTLYLDKKVRPLMFSEQGINSPDYSAANMDLQAAGIAYFWKKMERLPSLEAFQYHRWVDHTAEGANGLLCGVWKNTSGVPISFDGKKTAWFTYRDAGTANQDASFAFALPIIGISSWEEIYHPMECEVDLHTVRFELALQGRAAEDVLVDLQGEKKRPDPYGLVVFNRVASGRSLKYRVEYKDEWFIEDEVYIDGDKWVQQNVVSKSAPVNTSVNIYPNPFDSYLDFNTGTLAVFQLKLFDLSGRCVLKHILSGPERINLPDLPAGIYLLELSNGNEIYKQKMIKY